MSKGRSVDTTGQIDPSLKPLITSSANNIMQQQGANPVQDYNAPTIKGTAGLSDYQRFAGQQIGGLNQPNTGQQFGLAAIMNAMNSGNKKAAGQAAPSDDPRARTGGPSMSEYAKALAPYMGGNLSSTPTGSDFWQAPTPQGPMPRDINTGDPTAPGGGGSGGGGGGDGRHPKAYGKSSAVADSASTGPTTDMSKLEGWGSRGATNPGGGDLRGKSIQGGHYDSMGRFVDDSATGGGGFVGPSHTFSNFDPSTHSWQTIADQPSASYAGHEGQKWDPDTQTWSGGKPAPTDKSSPPPTDKKTPAPPDRTVAPR